MSDVTQKVLGNIDAAELRRRQIATAMKDPEHLKQWLRESGHEWLVFNTPELIDALPWPLGVDQLMDIVHSYTEHRSKIEAGRTETAVEPITGKEIQLPAYKSDLLEVEELDRAVRFLTRQLYILKPDWKLTDAPL